MDTTSMHSRIGLWGSSCALRLPKMAVESLGLKEGEKVNLQLEDGALVIRPATKRYDLNQLIEQAKLMMPPPVIDDTPMGNEVI